MRVCTCIVTSQVRLHADKPYDESLEIPDSEEVASIYTPTPRGPRGNVYSNSSSGSGSPRRGNQPSNQHSNHAASRRNNAGIWTLCA